MNHTPHIVASVFLCGMWIPVWLIIAATHNPPWRCSFCGYTDAIDRMVQATNDYHGGRSLRP